MRASPNARTLGQWLLGLFPDVDRQLKELLDDFATPRGLMALRSLGVASLFFELDHLTAEQIVRLDQAVAAGALVPAGTVLGVQYARLAGGRLRPVTEYAGRFALDIRRRPGGLELLLTPGELGDDMYVVAPGAASVVWEVSVTPVGSEPARYRRSPLNAGLLYGDSEEPLRLNVPPPKHDGEYVVELRDPETRARVASGRFHLP